MYPIRVLAKLGVKELISTYDIRPYLALSKYDPNLVTNASGALNPTYAVGSSACRLFCSLLSYADLSKL